MLEPPKVQKVWLVPLKRSTMHSSVQWSSLQWQTEVGKPRVPHDYPKSMSPIAFYTTPASSTSAPRQRVVLPDTPIASPIPHVRP